MRGQTRGGASLPSSRGPLGHHTLSDPLSPSDTPHYTHSATLAAPTPAAYHGGVPRVVYEGWRPKE